MQTSLFSGFRFQQNIYWATVLRLLVVMFLYTICRIAFYLYNISYFPEMTSGSFTIILLGGIRFDLMAVLYINSLYILLILVPFDFRFNVWYQKILKYLFIITNSIGLVANCADFIYYKFTLRRTTADVFSEFEEGPNPFVLFFRFIIDYWYVTIFGVVIIWLMVFLHNRIKVQGPMLKNRVMYYIGGVISIPIVIGLFIGGVRGGFAESTRPITLSNAGQYVKHAHETNIVLNTPFSVFRTVGKMKIKKLDYFSEDQLASIYNPIHIPSDTIPFRYDNVVIIILESFSREFFGTWKKDVEDYTGHTPFLDSLIQHSKTFEHTFANGRKSIDGAPSNLAGLPSMNVPFVLTPYANNRFNSLALLLKPKGYHTSFFSGQSTGAMGISAFTQLAGFDEYYGMEDYGNDDDFDGVWGIWDHKFFPYFAKKLGEFPEPFVSGIFSVSSHHPFKIPAEFKDRFKDGKKPILKCIEYTDYSLREMFKEMSKQDWYDNTVFVITADHCSSDILFEEGRTAWGLFSVPIIFYKPDNSLASFDDGIIQQIDILPSTLGYLHYDQPYFGFGRDVFREPEKAGWAISFRDDYHLFMDDYMLGFNGTNTTGLYNFKMDQLLKNNVMSTNPDRVVKMEEKIKAILQQYNNRMIENKLIVE